MILDCPVLAAGRPHIAALLAAARFIRVIPPGEWSGTSWIGRIVPGLVRLLGGRTSQE